MSFLVKGMEMPHSCGDCVLCRPKGPYPCYCYIKQFPIKPSETDLRDGLCPLVEVPTPHGRLIDADAAIYDIQCEILEHQMNGLKGTPCYLDDLRAMWQRLEDEDIIPTVIEAEE